MLTTFCASAFNFAASGCFKGAAQISEIATISDLIIPCPRSFADFSEQQSCHGSVEKPSLRASTVDRTSLPRRRALSSRLAGVMGERSPTRRQEDGRVRVLRILRERKARPSRFSRRQQMANRSPLASSRRSIERLKPPAQKSSEFARYMPIVCEGKLASNKVFRMIEGRRCE